MRDTARAPALRRPCAEIPREMSPTGTADPALLTKESPMKYLVPPIVIPILLFVGIVAYAMLRPPIIAGHLPAPAANSQAR
jgi:hypothetical protein